MVEVYSETTEDLRERTLVALTLVPHIRIISMLRSTPAISDLNIDKPIQAVVRKTFKTFQTASSNTR
jgi:hypothetical protein